MTWWAWALLVVGALGWGVAIWFVYLLGEMFKR